jgi:hypothetical protein
MIEDADKAFNPLEQRRHSILDSWCWQMVVGPPRSSRRRRYVGKSALQTSGISKILFYLLNFQSFTTARANLNTHCTKQFEQKSIG